MSIREKDIAGSNVCSPRLGIEITTRCNCACVYCFAGSGHTASAEIPTEIVKDILVQGYHTAYRHLHITGGEPLLYSHIFQVLDDAIELGYETILLNTNGLLLTGSICRKLADYPGLSVTISLEGTEALHERFRGTRSYQQVRNGLENGIVAGLDIIVFTTACKSLLPVLPGFADTLAAQFPGIRYLTLIRLINTWGDTFPLSGECLAPGDFLDLAKMVALVNLYGLRTHLLNDPLINVVSRMLDMPWVPASQDLSRGDSLMVMADLSIYSSHTGSDNYGKYAPGSMDKILVSDQYRQASTPDMQVCPACGFTRLCRANGLLRPAKWHAPGRHDSPFCKTVLDLIAR
jgi:MoaA/NifB/PqqE/SkfB family radical SAM enzyme